MDSNPITITAERSAVTIRTGAREQNLTCAEFDVIVRRPTGRGAKRLGFTFLNGAWRVTMRGGAAWLVSVTPYGRTGVMVNLFAPEAVSTVVHVLRGDAEAAG